MFEKLQRLWRSSRLRLEPTEENESGPCDCCGDVTRRVSGFVNRGDETEAAYLVEWTKGKVSEHGAHVDLIVGAWGDASTATERVAVSLEYRRTDTGPWFMVIDSADRAVAKNELVGKALTRDDVMGTPLAQRVFDMVDAIWAEDGRLADVTRAPTATARTE
jgi:hypothetical protein